MNLSEFRHAVRSEFGAHGDVLLQDLIIPELSHRSCQEALSDGVPARNVWEALCQATELPIERRVPVRLPQQPR